MNRDDISEYQPTPKQEQALREYLHEAVVPLIEDVLVKKLGQAMAYLKEQQQPEQEPVAWLWKNIDGHQVLTDDPDYADGTWTPLYTTPPKREWVGLTDYEIESELTKEFGQWWSRHVSVCRAIEAKLKEKNNG